MDQFTKDPDPPVKCDGSETWLFDNQESNFFYISLKNSGIPGLWDFIFFLSSTFVYEPILFKISMNADIVKTHFFYKIKYDHSITFLFKNSLIILFMLLIKETNAAKHYQRTKFDLYKDDICFNLNLRSYGQLFVLVFIKI